MHATHTKNATEELANCWNYVIPHLDLYFPTSLKTPINYRESRTVQVISWRDRMRCGSTCAMHSADAHRAFCSPSVAHSVGHTKEKQMDRPSLEPRCCMKSLTAHIPRAVIADLHRRAWHAVCKLSGSRRFRRISESSVMTQNLKDSDQQGRQDANDRQERAEQSRQDQARQDPDPQHRKEQDRNPQDRRG